MQMIAAALLLGVAALAGATEPTCSADGLSCGPAESNVTGTDPYFWPMAMGHPKYYSSPPWPIPTDLQKTFKWSWFGQGKRYEEAFVGGALDDKKYIYVSGDRTAYKLSPDGKVEWAVPLPGQSSGTAPALFDGKFIGATTDGKVYALDMATGEWRWVTKASEADGLEYSQLAAHKGVVLTQGDQMCKYLPFPGCSQRNVRGLNATDGAVLWKYDAEEVLWDWFPQFPDDETVLFMDRTGGLHKLRLQTGELLWKVGGTPDTWTDGSQFMASNGLTYTVEVSATACRDLGPGHVRECEGYVTAYRTSDGERVWRATVPKPPNTSPAVGRLTKGGRLAVVMAIGQQSEKSCSPPWGDFYARMSSLLPGFVVNWLIPPIHAFSVWLGDSNGMLWGTSTRTHDVWALDAETGERLWTWSGPTSHRRMNRGDDDGFLVRMSKGMRMVCCPTPWGQPRIDQDGTIVVPNENGDVFAIRDENGDNKIGDGEVSVYQTMATFPHHGTLHAPGMMVAVNFDGVFVWKS